MKSQRIILAWDQDDLRQWCPTDILVPLTAEAYVAAFEMPKAAIVDPRECFGGLSGVWQRSIELTDPLHDIVKSSHFPWFEAYINVSFHIKIFQLIAWLGLIRALRTEFQPLSMMISPPTIPDNLAIYRLAKRSFNLAREILQCEGIQFVSPSNCGRKSSELRKTLKRILARTCAMTLRSDSPSLGRGVHHFADSASIQKHTDAILVSQQYTDAFHAGPLAGHLATSLGDSFLWVGMPPQVVPGMTSEEKDLVTSVNLNQLRFVDSVSLGDESIIRSRRSSLVDLGSAWKMAAIMTKQTELGVSREQWLDFLMDPDFRGFASRYQLWNRFLNGLRPKVVIGLSTLQDMALVRAWARRKRVSFVQLMHGVFPVGEYSYLTDADYLGVFGKIDTKCVTKSHSSQPRLVKACGAMQFWEKAGSSSRARGGQESERAQNAILFLGGFGWLPFCPWSPAELWTMLRDIHRAAIEFGKVLRVRPHPRYPSTVLKPYVFALRDEFPDTIDLSNEMSIRKDFGTADFIVASGFDGAVLDALIDKRVVISYLPTGVSPGSDSKLFERMGAMAYGYEELKKLFSSLVLKAQDRADLQQTQDQFFRDYIEDFERDPWKGALDLINEALQRSARPSQYE